MTRLHIDTLTEDILQSNKNVMILDTCCLLDIIRSIFRQRILDYETAISILVNQNSDDLQIVFPSLVLAEWNSNQSSVQDELQRYLKNWDKSYKIIKASIEYFYGHEIDYMNAHQFDLDKGFVKISKSILELGKHITAIDDCKVKAYQRVIEKIPPAAQAKDSLKDCTIFEETLLLARKLRERDFKKKIIFATTNIKDFAKNNEVRSSIETELKKYSAILATSLSEGYYISKQN